MYEKKRAVHTKKEGDEFMQENYEVVPNIITGKDLDYLSDMFNWNCSIYKKLSNCIQQVEENDVKDIITRASKMFHENTNTILNILNQGGSNE